MFKRTICVLISACLLMGMVSFDPLSVRAEGEGQTEAAASSAETTQATQTTLQPAETTQATETTAPPTETTVPPTETTAPPTETTVPPTETTVPEEDFTENETRMSDKAIALLKQYEGFSKYPTWDVSQWSVGYGTRCPGDKLELWKAIGITEREAESLLNAFVNNFGAKLDAFIEKYNLTLNQYQYDALMLFTYNCGAGWMNQEGLLQTAVITGATGNDFIYPFVLWCKADRVFSNGLIERRLAEANLYLNGVYGRRPPSDYSFVRFDVNGGASDYAVQGFDVDEPVPIKVIAETTYTASNGAIYEFDGWYTARNGGTKVETLDRSFGYGITLYAHWNLIKEGSGPAQDNEFGGTTTLVDVLVTATNLNVRLGPGQSYDYAPSRSYPKGTQLTIVETKSDGAFLWGKIANTGETGYWVALDYTNYYEVIQNQPSVTQPTVPPTTQPTVPPTTQPTVPPTTQPTVPPTTQPTTPPTTQPTVPPTTQPTVPPTTQPTTPPTTKPTEPESVFGTWQGVVKTAGSQLRIRSSANLSASVTGFLTNGAAVTIVERKVVGNLEWGRMEKGWISLKYVSFDPVDVTPPTTQPAPTEPAPTQPAPTELAPTQPAPTEPAPTQPAPTEPAPTQPVPTDPPQTEGMQPVFPDGDGYWIGVVNTAFLSIRSGAGTVHTIVGYYKLGDSIEITRCITVDGQFWGRVDNGWICLMFVALDGEESLLTDGFMTVNTSSLRVRSGAGLENTIVTYLSFGDVIAIHDRQQVGSTLWGLTELGWVDLQYLK